MTRKKVKLAFITNDSARKATYKKRKKGLMKKVSELSTLCGIEACAIIDSPYESQPEIWPSHGGVQRVLSKFKNLSEMEQSKKMVNQESFLRQRISKAYEQLKKQCRENREKEITHVMFQNLTGKDFNDLNMIDLNDLGWLIEKNLKDISQRVDTLNGPSHSSQGRPAPSSSSSSSSTKMVRSESITKSGQMINAPAGKFGPAEANVDRIQRQLWFMDLLNPQDLVGFGGGDETTHPFGDNKPNALWSNAFFPWEK